MGGSKTLVTEQHVRPGVRQRTPGVEHARQLGPCRCGGGLARGRDPLYAGPHGVGVLAHAGEVVERRRALIELAELGHEPFDGCGVSPVEDRRRPLCQVAADARQSGRLGEHGVLVFEHLREVPAGEARHPRSVEART